MHATIKEHIAHVATSPKIAAAVTTATAGTGLGSVLDLIPDDIGKLAVLVGIVLSSLLIYSHSLTVRKQRIELRRLQAEEVERLAQNGG